MYFHQLLTQGISLVHYWRVRLAGGSTASEGKVDICYGGTWYSVCDDNWGTNEARVVCRQLGYCNDRGEISHYIMMLLCNLSVPIQFVYTVKPILKYHYMLGAWTNYNIYSGTSEQRTRWGQYKFSCCVLCREVVLFSEVQKVYM